MSKRTRPLALFLLMLWVPALAMFAGRLGGCAAPESSAERADFHAPAKEAGYSATDAEGVVLF